jgi:hypothetical protein
VEIVNISFVIDTLDIWIFGQLSLKQAQTISLEGLLAIINLKN